ncbi:MAG: type IX secretion system membrane protein PorP/SprF, partial [Actinobacteria bacterium]|nr:type IX secretion system membrane protein PorP/SprF [Actinomycetota bacterium]
MKTRTILFLSIFLCFLNANAQFYSSMNTVYYSSPSITFYNPAPPVLIGRPYAFAGMQLLHLGLSEDNLRNNFVTLVEPVGSSTAIGLRAQYFTSNIFQKGNYSLLISQKVYKNIFSIGLNANFLTFGYNTSKFKLFDFHDPVINDGTSQNAISYGAGIFMQPIHGLLLGASADHLNKPDISLDKSSILQERIYHFGLALCFLPVIPQFDVRMEGNEILKQGGLHLDLLNHRLDIFAGYNQFSFGGSGIFAQLEMSFGDIGILYSYQNPLTEDFNHVSNGSHQIGIFYTKSKTPIPPKIYLEDNPSRQSLPQFTLIGRIESPDGLKLIEIYDNQDLIKRIECSDNIKTKEINEPFNLKRGDNKIRVVAY